MHRGADRLGGKVDESVPLDKAALVGCGVTTGYGSTINTGDATAGSTVVVMGVGGVGINAVQAARIVGARHIVALDPIEYKRTRAMEFGATHTAATLTLSDINSGYDDLRSGLNLRGLIRF